MLAKEMELFLSQIKYYSSVNNYYKNIDIFPEMFPFAQ